MANNIIVPIPTELKDIKSELMFGLTKRQVIGFGITGLVVIPSFLLLKKVDINLAMYGSFVIAVPFIFFTIYSKDKMYAEKWLKNWIEKNILYKEKRLYKINNRNMEVAIARGFINNVPEKKPIPNNKSSNSTKKK